MTTIDHLWRCRRPLMTGGALLGVSLAGVMGQALAQCGANPCAAKNPCAVQQACAPNPCAAKNPCAADNPCAAKNSCTANPCAANPCAANPCATKNPCAANPCAAKNPCAANPCAAKNPCAAASARNPCAVKRPDNYTPGYREDGDNVDTLIARGKALFQDASLSTNGLACASCHGVDQDSAYQATFASPFPHRVAMGESLYGMSMLHADEMVQVCMLNPMAASTLGWDSEELSALSAYVVEVQKRYAGEPHRL
ncbi:hypothetical protein [Halomonas sp. YLGW01]|uniref:c-type cytochrome n=1 Tax=Halomonas sp. YLGW01 TaxID=2773308 RepID=UPI00192DB0C9|nr:hypothetical protein [Halomonas sp. YLGW01]